jgi:DNA-binding PadR family transcriptional regulator
MYSPSAGTVYPRLARLEEEGLVEREDDGRKSVYRITDAGRAEVRARQHELAELHADVTESVRRLAQEVREQVRVASQDLRGELAAAARAARAASRTTSTSSGWTGTSGPAEASLERFRNTVRRELRSRGITPERLAQLDAVLASAEEQIRALLGPRD